MLCSSLRGHRSGGPLRHTKSGREFVLENPIDPTIVRAGRDASTAQDRPSDDPTSLSMTGLLLREWVATRLPKPILKIRFYLYIANAPQAVGWTVVLGVGQFALPGS